jgi:hypothetical protein
MPPLSFSAEEMDLLLEFARPIEPAQRSAFLDAVAAAIGEQASGPGPRPPDRAAGPAAVLDAAPAVAQREQGGARLKGRSSKLEH